MNIFLFFSAFTSRPTPQRLNDYVYFSLEYLFHKKGKSWGRGEEMKEISIQQKLMYTAINPSSFLGPSYLHTLMQGCNAMETKHLLG